MNSGKNCFLKKKDTIDTNQQARELVNPRHTTNIKAMYTKKGRKCTDIAIMAKHNGCLAIMQQAGNVIGTSVRGSTKIKDIPMTNKYIQDAIQ